MASSIDITKPVTGNATTQSVRDNFAFAKTEIEALQDGKQPLAAVLTNTTASFTTAQETKLAGVASNATANSSDATLLARANHTGTQSADTLTDGTTNKAFLATERTKLAGIATGATANDTDANLKNRANHTGTQLASTISDFAATVRATVLTGLSLASSTAISATDTVLVALGSLQKQISDLVTTVAGKITASSTDTLTNKTISGASNTLTNIAQSSVTSLTTDLALKAPLASPTFTGTVSGVSKAMVGLGNVDNTSDANKPVSTAQQTALDAKASLAVGNQFTKNQYGNTGTTTYGATIALDLSIHKHVVTTAGNLQLIAPTNQPAAGFICSGILEVIQGATGGSLSVLNTFWKVTGGTVPTGSTGTGKKDIWAYSVENGVGYLVQIQKDSL